MLLLCDCPQKTNVTAQNKAKHLRLPLLLKDKPGCLSQAEELKAKQRFELGSCSRGCTDLPFYLLEWLYRRQRHTVGIGVLYNICSLCCILPEESRVILVFEGITSRGSEGLGADIKI